MYNVALSLFLLFSPTGGCEMQPKWTALELRASDELKYIGQVHLRMGSYCLYDYRHFWSGRETARLVVSSREGKLLGYYAFPVRSYGKVQQGRLPATNIDGETEVIEFSDRGVAAPRSIYFDGGNFMFTPLTDNK
ncbi:hypothetical protein [Frateuria sp. STR12]|uniref:hypothetical protein n=1 Tax=Frateuria hangzhouensis TaxID=2995589 RepID=UPI0022608E01|nr:hypothetical protein [Frateuria sp. STR12]MCX7513172.1 hypothetical protein [Frateuria sp. STR12]